MKAFYTSAGAVMESSQIKALFEQLAMAEEHHKSSLTSLFREFSGKEADPDTLHSSVGFAGAEAMLEGGVPLQKALQWLEGREPREVLELSVSIESNAYDRYLYMMRQVAAEPVKKVFQTLSWEEKAHLQKLTDLFGSFI